MTKTGILGSVKEGYIEPLSSVQEYLPKGYKAEQEQPGTAWYGTYRITRPNLTYFHALSFEDIEKRLHEGEK